MTRRKFDTSPARYDGEAPLGMPGRAFVITNSERTAAGCARRWWFAEDQGLRPKTRSRPLRLGLAWHAVLEDAHRWWMEFDTALPPTWTTICPWCGGVGKLRASDALFVSDACVRCSGTGFGPYGRVGDRWSSLVRDGRLDAAEAAEDMMRLARMIEGWGEFYSGWKPYRSLRVVAVEVSIARPIRNPRTGAVFAPRVALVEHEDGRRRYARAGEVHQMERTRAKSSRIVWARWPWYYVGRLDTVLASRDRPAKLVVGEFKSNANPSKFARDLALDPQVPGYLWLLEHAISQRLAPWAEDCEVDGWQYDLTSSSMQREPKLLKRGGISKAKANTPSWLYRRAVQQQGLDPNEYADVIARCASRVDPKLYQRQFGDAQLHDIDRVGEEVFGFASRVAEMRRASATARDLVDINVATPRTPLCRLPGGSCAFVPICHADSPKVRSEHFFELPGWWGDPDIDEVSFEDEQMPDDDQPEEQE